jgi:hypothetical protein
MFIHILALITALVLSGVSGFYSVFGLTTIFAGAFYPVLFMGGSLELGKLVTASWLYNNWSICPRILKYYLSCIVIVLMLISSMGTFGFLSKAHIDAQVKISQGGFEKVDIINQKLEFEKQILADLNGQATQIDNAVNTLNTKGKASQSLNALNSQRKNKQDLFKQKEAQVKKIGDLTAEKAKIDGELKKLEAEVGPVKYLAELIYGGTADGAQLEKAVRAVIIVIVLVFDPLAVSLLIAANIGLRNRKKRFTLEDKHDILVVDERVFKREGINDVEAERKIDKE